ncbi:MAG: tetratricopeptide repeat protein [Symploca sp. SIO1C4]|uniref:Tetratricopeptide repeat protein n=1 Tax=Symploca sp. SIO1C4 TaxID=2607765 RepID=A0A6B3NF95_9CYAN|nr:tetratricopeptide repeat protein [Symploca sp. SIO1C4]
MKPTLIKGEKNLVPDPEDEYQALVRSLKWTDGFRLLFVHCSPAQGEQVITRIKEDILQKTIEVLSLDKPLDNLYECIDKLQKQRQINILFITGIEKSLIKYIKPGVRGQGDYYNEDSVPRILGNLNLQRERFRDNFKICLVFILPLFALKFFIRRAPDFFDWHSSLFELPPEPEFVEQESSRLLREGSYQEYLNLPQEQQRQKIWEIQDLLDQTNLESNSRADLLLEQAKLLNAAKEYELAISNYEQVLKIKPESYKVWYFRGISLENLDQYEEAVDSYDIAIKIQPVYHRSWSHRGDALNELGCYEEAVNSYDKSLELQPDHHYAWHHRGIALKNLGRYEKAVKSYKKALKIRANEPQILYHLGNALSELGRFQDAIASYSQALEIKPDFHQAWIALGKLRDSNALKPLIKILQENSDADLRYEAIEALGKLKNQDAYQALLKALQDENADICAVAIRTLGRYGDVSIAPQLVELLNHEDRYVREHTALELGKLAKIEQSRELVLPIAIDHLIRIRRNDPIRDVREAVQQVLETISCLQGEDQEIWKARLALKAGESVRVKQLFKAQQHGDLDQEEAVEQLIDLLTDKSENPDERAAAALALGEIREIAAHRAIPCLIEALNDQDRFVREDAAKALGQLHAQEAIDALNIANREDVISNVRTAAEDALYKIYENANADQVKEKAGCYLQFAGRIPLVKSQELAKDSISTLLSKLINSDNAYERFRAAETLGEILKDSGNKVDVEVVDSLIEALDDQSLYVGAAAADALGQIH